MSSILKQTLLLVFAGFSTFAQVETETNPPDFIKSITFKGGTSEAQIPIVKLGESIMLEFDALNASEDDFYYKIEHFDFNWTRSNLMRTEYIKGVDNQRIFDYENSFNTYEIYSHYRLRIPNNQTRGLLKTGNYMLKIFNEDDELVFSRKFMIYQEKANVGVAIKRSRDVRFISKKQSVDISISPRVSSFNNPQQTIKTLVIQNNNLNTAISDLKPQYTIGNELIYKYDTESSFWGGNEYLFLDTKDPRAANVGTRAIDLKDIYHNYQYTDIIRGDQSYTYNPDINGNFVVTAIDVEDPSVQADYIWVHFYLDYPEFLEEKNIYVYGNFNNFKIEEATKLNYNEEIGVFETQIKLKQGFYNYKYVIVDDQGRLDEGAISGNFDMTENNYKVLVYYRDLAGRYDEIIGLGEGTSLNISN